MQSGSLLSSAGVERSRDLRFYKKSDIVATLSLAHHWVDRKIHKNPYLKLGSTGQFLEKVYFSLVQCSRCDIFLNISIFSLFFEAASDSLLLHTVGR